MAHTSLLTYSTACGAVKSLVYGRVSHRDSGNPCLTEVENHAGRQGTQNGLLCNCFLLA